ncbi:MAG: septum formation protein Maf [Saprospiraceae bacterium]|nr:septum formation protein Maf [Saprospiraceae bacterium]
MNILKNKKLILGSKSPRRRQLLTDAGFVFEMRMQDTNEDFDLSLPVLEVAETLAIRKAEALINSLTKDEILITADSVVILNNTIYNKPTTYDEGVRMLKTLAGQTHTVATGVCLLSISKTVSFTSLTYVTFDQMTGEEIDYYLVNHQPYDKAGGYGIQDWIGLCKVKSIEGSYSNVMGLPVRDVYDALKRF